MELEPRSQTKAAGERCLVFVPGFLIAPRAYRSLLAPVAAAGVRVVVPLLTRPGPAALAGRVTPEQEAAQLGAIVDDLRRSHRAVWVGGHSRGAFVAWLTGGSTEVNGLVLVDPVSGGGPPWASVESLHPAVFPSPPIVIGLGEGGRCAPVERGHRAFAAAAPGCVHVVVPDAAHADVLDGWWARFGGLVCTRGADADASRRAVAELLVELLVGVGD